MAAVTRRRFLQAGVAALGATAAMPGLLVPVPAAYAISVRLAVPFLTQFDGSAYAATNCGPTSLAMVLRYFSPADGSTPDGLRRALMKLPGAGYAADPGQGTAIQDLATLARQRGLQALMGPGPSSTGWTPERLAESLDQGRLPIVLTRLNALPGWAAAPNGLDHWIALVGASGDRFVYNDSALSAPAGAGLSISRDGLERAMRLAGVPTQGAAFFGPLGLGSASVYPRLPVELPPDERTPVRVVVGLVRLGNGGLGARPPVRVQYRPDGSAVLPEGSPWDLARLSRFVPL